MLRRMLCPGYLFSLAVIVLLSLAGSAFAEIGTMDNPIPIGQAVNLSIGWQLKVLSVVHNANKYKVIV